MCFEKKEDEFDEEWLLSNSHKMTEFNQNQLTFPLYFRKKKILIKMRAASVQKLIISHWVLHARSDHFENL